MKWKPGLSTRLNFPKNSTVLTVFGPTIRIARAISIISSTTATGTPAIHPVPILMAGITNNNKGTIKRNIIYTLRSKHSYYIAFNNKIKENKKLSVSLRAFYSFIYLILVSCITQIESYNYIDTTKIFKKWYYNRYILGHFFHIFWKQKQCYSFYYGK